MKADGECGVTSTSGKSWLNINLPTLCIKMDNSGEIREEVTQQDEFLVLCCHPSCTRDGAKRFCRCLQAWYCSRDHQKMAWAEHKSVCKEFSEW
mmetsp:Transcript_6931/g.12362  ORF Transcript_6931/g.12362 Transcript_6931/m.12362 type:complete len:94 (+) Transcript_6931:100-381(+)